MISDVDPIDENETVDTRYESEIEMDVRSIVTVPQLHHSDLGSVIQDSNDLVKVDQPMTTPPIPADFLDVLGDSKIREVPLGPKIPEEVSKRWGGILMDGLNRDHKKELLSTTLIPENFQLLKAPLLNQEIASVMIDSSKNRDKRLERAQNHLGVGIAGLTSLISSLMEGKEVDKLEMVKKLSEVGQILLDLHHENTVNRRMLITPSLDKKFLQMTQDVKRDTYLFGANLGEKIKAVKAAEKSGLQIKNMNNIGPQASGSKKFPNQQGNWKGPPRQQGQRVVRQGGSKQRIPSLPPKRTNQTATNRYQGAAAARPTYRPPTRK